MGAKLRQLFNQDNQDNEWCMHASLMHPSAGSTAQAQAPPASFVSAPALIVYLQLHEVNCTFHPACRKAKLEEALQAKVAAEDALVEQQAQNDSLRKEVGVLQVPAHVAREVSVHQPLLMHLDLQ